VVQGDEGEFDGNKEPGPEDQEDPHAEEEPLHSGTDRLVRQQRMQSRRTLG
jgi:hypothetical protein